MLQLDVDIDSMIVCVSIFSCSFSVKMYYSTVLSTVLTGFALYKFSFKSNKLPLKTTYIQHKHRLSSVQVQTWFCLC